MNIKIRSLSLLAGSVLIGSTLVLAGCKDTSKDTAPPAATDTPRPAAASDAVTPTNGAPSTDDADHAAEMEQHHRQEMDHEEMRRGGMGPRESNAPDPQPSGNQSMPMDHM